MNYKDDCLSTAVQKDLSDISVLKEDIQNSYMSLPTILLYFASLSGNITGYVLQSNGYYISSLLLSGFSCYAHFTVAHDAIHHSVSKNRYINNTFGILSQFWLGPTTNWIGLKECHLKHHAYTNNAKLDPDIWSSTSGPGGALLTPLRWLTIDAHYWYFVPEIAKSHPYQFFIHELFIVSLILVCYYNGRLWDLFYCWILPSRLALFILAFAFDFLPHYPHKITKEQNKYLTTMYISSPSIIRPIVTCLIFAQNYHYAHHLHPSVPFYKYYKIWYAKKSTYIKHFGDSIIRRIFTFWGKETV